MFVTYLQIFSFLVLFSSGHEELFVHVQNVIIRNNLQSVLMSAVILVTLQSLLTFLGDCLRQLTINLRFPSITGVSL